MTKIATAAMVAILFGGPALSDAESDQIRAKLLATPAWTYERGQPPVETGKVSFVEKDGKLIGNIDIGGFKCDTEVTLHADGFAMSVCAGSDRHYVRSGNEFKVTYFGNTYTIRPTP